MKEKILVLAYPGTGKTYVAEHYANTSDFEFQHYRYDYGEYKNLPLETLKGKTDIRKPNADWPNNFFDALNKELNVKDIVLVPLSTSVLNELHRLKNVRIILAISSDFENLKKTYANRNNSPEFIERRKNDFQKFYDIVKNSDYEKIFLDHDEYLVHAMLNKGIKLSEGEGAKNYL